MQRELVPLPQGTTIIPSEYAIFLSDADDKEWQGVKRRGLEQGLYHILAERAKEIAGKRKLETKSFVIELRVDGTLLVKRLLIHPVGRRVTIQSDNPAYADLPDCALDEIDCVGRVIWTGRKIA